MIYHLLSEKFCREMKSLKARKEKMITEDLCPITRNFVKRD